MEERKNKKEKRKNRTKSGREKNKFKVYSILQYRIVELNNRLIYDLETSKRWRRDAGLTNACILSSTPAQFLHVFMASTGMTLFLRNLIRYLKRC